MCEKTQTCLIYKNMDRVPHKSNAACQNDGQIAKLVVAHQSKTLPGVPQRALQFARVVEKEHKDGFVLLTHLIKENISFEI